MRKLIFFWMLVAGLIAGVGTAANKDAQCEGANGGAGTAPAGKQSLLDAFHNPCPGVTMGADFRFRVNLGKNMDTLEDDPADHRGNKYFFNRYRGRWWTTIAPQEWQDISFNMRLVWEFRNYDEPAARTRQHTDFDEIIFDRFNLTVGNLFDSGWAAVIGRQDIMFGTGWLVCDATPKDGSRTFFYDALRLTKDWAEKKTKVDLIYISNAASSARWLKPINDRNNALTKEDEQGVIAYVTNNSLRKSQLEGYFMYKNDNPIDHDMRNQSVSSSRKGEVFTEGGAVQHKFNDKWQLRSEAAVQQGHKNDSSANRHTLQAWGTRNDLTHFLLDEMNNSFHLAYEYLSGDDPDSSKIEQFDPLWSEGPQWSELYIYTYGRETTMGEVTNLHRLNFGHKFKPHEKIEIKTDYHLLWADENTLAGTNLADGFGFSNHGKFRGQLFTCWVYYTLTKQIKGHLMGEYFIPGNYYQHGTRDHAFFMWFNIEYTF